MKTQIRSAYKLSISVAALGLLFSMLLSQVSPSLALPAGNRIPFNNQNLFMSGANVAWVNYAADIGASTNLSAFDSMFSDVHAHGGNSMRLWLHTNGSITPVFDGTGKVSGPGTTTIADLKNILDLAWKYSIGVDLCLWSFDMLQTQSGVNITNNMNILTNTTYTNAYINNALIPIVNGVKGHPAILAWEIFNEPEGMTNEFGWSSYRVNMSDVQRTVNLLAGAIHRTDPNALVTNGSWSFKASSDCCGYFNYYTDARLQAAGGDALGYLDFYEVHYYNWGGTALSPFNHPASYWGLTKPLLIAEFYAQDEPTLGITGDQLYNNLYNNGYAGAWAWMYQTGPNRSLQLSDMQTLFNNHRSDVEVIKGSATATPTPTATSAPGTTTVDDSVQGTGQNQFNYAGAGWSHCTNCNEGGAAIFYNASQSWNTATNDSVTMAFTGTQIKYYAVKAPDVGIAAVSIDGGAETNVDLYMTPKTGNVLVWTSPTLTSGSHTFKVRNTGTKNGSSSGTTITLDRVDILSGGATATPTRTNTPIPPTATKTNTPVPPTATPSGNTHAGTWALKSVFTSTASWKNAQEQPSVTGSQTYVASVWIKGTGSVQLQVMNGNWGTAIVTVRCDATGSWVKCSSGSFSTGTNTMLTYAFRDAYGVASTLYLDDAFLGVSGGSNVLSNAGFESGNVNWILDTGGQYTILQP